jgi:3',5'-cyclic AMP phosphodiesterase CpdA
LAANPVGISPLQIEEEARAIRTEMEIANPGWPFELVPRMAARPMDLLRGLRDVRPTIVHFAGHADTDGIYLTGDGGAAVHVTRDTLLATFGAAGDSVQIVVLNSCATESLADALRDFVPVCVGTSAGLTDTAASMFSIGFYGALAAGVSVARAYLHGCAAMRFVPTGEHSKPRLCHRRDVDPEAMFMCTTTQTRSTPEVQGTLTAHSPAATNESTPTPHFSFSVPYFERESISAATTRAAPMTDFVPNATGTDVITPLVLLQISDLHFGPHSRFVGLDTERLAGQCRQALDEARRDLDWQESVGLVIVTGDIAEAARPPEYATAAAFFRAFARELALSTHRFVFVPGNHDISWTKCREIEGQLEDGAFPARELRARLDAVKLAHFEGFIREVHGGKARHEVDGAAVTSLGHGVFLHDFPDLGISVAALNSCERESHRKEDHVGAIGEGQAQAVLDHWRTTPDELIRIVAVHHNPSTMASAAIKQWLEFLRSSNDQITSDVVERIATNFVGFEGHEYLHRVASDAHAALVLHGHHHVSTDQLAWSWRGRDPAGPGDTRIVSAGSWGLSPESGKLPKDQPLVMQLIRLDPAAMEMRPVLLKYEPNARLVGHVSLGRFVLDSETRVARPIGLSLPAGLRGRLQSSTYTRLRS